MIIGFLFQSFWSYNDTYRTARDQAIAIVSVQLENASLQFSRILSNAEISVTTIANMVAHQGIKKPPDVVTPLMRYDRYRTLKDALISFELADENVRRIRYYLLQSDGIFTDKMHLFPIDNMPPELSGFASDDPKPVWTYSYIQDFDGSAEHIISCVKLVRSGRPSPSTLGKLAYDIRTRNFRDLFTVSSIGPARLWFSIVNRDGNVLYTDHKEKQSDEFYRYIDEIENTEDTDTMKVLGNRLYLAQPDPRRNYFTVAEVDLTSIRQTGFSLALKSVLLAMVVLGLVYLVIVFTTRNLVHRINRVIKEMDTIEHNNFQETLKIVFDDEISELKRTFNAMATRIKKLIEDVYETRLHLLQFQFDPHFLYNTLDTIHWMADRHNAQDIAYSVEQLSDYLRFSLSHKSSVTLLTELEHLRAYYNIQKIKYEDLIELCLDIPVHLLHCKTIPFALQPIVENAIRHGMRNERDVLLINIEGKNDTDVLILTVRDNGKGIGAEKLSEITDSLNNRDSYLSESLGLRNVHRRLQAAFGEQYGISVFGKIDHGATITLQFPMSDT
ncbi:MAG: sensor histidine kinase [Spirochaetales bacterium]|nr:sensor histidine kinase [Spirochaetales bacterium]